VTISQFHPSSHRTLQSIKSANVTSLWIEVVTSDDITHKKHVEFIFYQHARVLLRVRSRMFVFPDTPTIQVLNNAIH